MDIKLFTCNIFSGNCYLITTEDVCLLVDPGFGGKEEIAQLLDHLNGRVPDAILLTHAHFDHTLGLVPLQKLWPETPVYMSPEDAVVLKDNSDFCRILGVKGADFSFSWLPVSDGEVLSFGGNACDGNACDGSACGGNASDDNASDGNASDGNACDGNASDGNASDDKNGEGTNCYCAQNNGGALQFKAIATPGHTPGSICWYCESHNIIFTGDTLFADSIGRSDLPHGDYDAEIKSIMEKLMPLPGDTDVYPGHGGATTIGRERISNPFLEPFNEPLDNSDDSELSPIEIHTDL